MQGLVGWTMVTIPVVAMTDNSIFIYLNYDKLYCIVCILFGLLVELIGFTLMMIFMYKQKYVILSNGQDLHKDNRATPAPEDY